jgi:TolA-binding protein
MKLRFFPNLTKFCCLIKLFWLLLAGIMFVLSIYSCSAPRNYKNKLKSNSFNKSITNEIKNSIQEEINTLSKDIPPTNNDYTYIDEIDGSNNPKKSTIAGESNYHFPTLKEQIKQIKNNQEKTDIRLDGLELDIKTLQQDVSDMKYGLKATDKKNDNFNPENSKKRHQIQSSKDIILSDEEIAAKDELKQNNNQQNSDEVNNVSVPDNSKRNLNKNENAVNIKKPAKTDLEHNKSQKSQSKNNVSLKNQIKGNKQTKIISDNKYQNQNFTPNENLAMKYFSTQEYDKAIGEFNKSVQTEKDATKINNINYYIGESYFGLRQWDKAVSFFDHVIKSSNSNKKAEAQIMIAEAHIRSGQTSEAKKAFQALIEQYPKSNYIPRARKMLQML